MGIFDNCVGVLVTRVIVFTVFCIVCTVFFVLFGLCIFILICFVCKDYCHRVTIQLQLVVVVIRDCSVGC